jgi:hypothetical protein
MGVWKNSNKKFHFEDLSKGVWPRIDNLAKNCQKTGKWNRNKLVFGKKLG